MWCQLRVRFCSGPWLKLNVKLFGERYQELEKNEENYNEVLIFTLM